MEETPEKTAEKTSTWLALRNPVFRRLWSAMVISGSCIGAHNTAVYWAMHKLGASTLHIALMTTVSALPYTLFTLPAGAIADMADRKKILLTVQIWHASIAFALAILWMAHLLNPYLILVSAFLFSAGFAFGSPAHSSVIAEMVSKDDLASALYSRRNADGSLGDYRASVFSALTSVGRSKFHLWRQRAWFPSDVSGASAVEAGKDAVKPSVGELL
jgi:MFS family permease